jgi:hypothetical protein
MSVLSEGVMTLDIYKKYWSWDDIDVDFYDIYIVVKIVNQHKSYTTRKPRRLRHQGGVPETYPSEGKVITTNLRKIEWTFWNPPEDIARIHTYLLYAYLNLVPEI